MASASDPHSLLALGHYRQALTALEQTASRRALFTDEQIIQAELHSLTGSVETSIALSEKLIGQRGLGVGQRCRLRDVLGVSHYRKGQHTKGGEHYRRGIELAESEGDLASECRLRVHLLRNQNHWTGPLHAAVQLSTLRRKVHRLADPPLTLKFQLGLTEIAAKLGLSFRARKHLNAAISLIPTVADRGIHADVKIAEIALSAMDSDVEGALRHAFELVGIAEETGSESARFGTSTNLGHLLLLQSRFDEALTWLQKGLRERDFGGGSEIALRDTLMSLQISRDLIGEAQLEASAIKRLLDDTGTHDSYIGLWHVLNRVKWLYRTDQANTGVAVAMDAIPRIERMADRNLLERMKLLAAEGLGRIGRAADGARLMAEAVSANPDPPLEMMAEASRVAGRLTADGKSSPWPVVVF